jgi:hypothetical protein
MASNDLMSAISSGFNNVTNAVNGEVQKIGKRTVDNVTSDFNEVSDGIKKGGLGGGAVSLFDVASPGHQAANLADEAGLIGHDHNSRQMLAATINGGVGIALTSSGNPLGLLLMADGIAEGVDGVGGAMKSGQVQNPQAPVAPMAPYQANVEPGAAYDDARARALAMAKEKAHLNTAYDQGYLAGERAQAARDHANGGYGVPSYGEPVYGGPMYGGPGFDPSYGGGAVGGGNISNTIDQQGANLQQIMNDPNMSFEDKLFALLQGVVGNQEKQIESDEAAVAGPNAPKDENSRAQAVQKIQNEVQKLQEMQASLDAIMTAMHDMSMNTIRNIK